MLDGQATRPAPVAHVYLAVSAFVLVMTPVLVATYPLELAVAAWVRRKRK